MKIDRLETHDRYEEFTKKDFDITECCLDLIRQRPFGDHPFYIFAHARTDDDGVTKRLIWQPRLTKPRAQVNSMLFKAKPGTEDVEIFWIIPAPEMWEQYEKGKVTESETIMWSIHQFKTNKAALEKKEDDDLSDKEIDAIYREISIDAQRKKGLKPKAPMLEI